MPDSGGVVVSAEWIRDQVIKITALCERIMTKQEEQDKRIEEQNKRFSKIEEKVDEINGKPAKRWDGVVTAFLAALVGALITAYFSMPKL